MPDMTEAGTTSPVDGNTVSTSSPTMNGGQVVLQAAPALPNPSSDPVNTSFLFQPPPAVPPKPSFMSATSSSSTSEPSPTDTSSSSVHRRSASTATQVSFMRIPRGPVGGQPRSKSPVSMVATGSTTSLPSTVTPTTTTTTSKPVPAAKPSWLRRTASGSKAIATTFGIGGGGSKTPPDLRSRTPPSLPSRQTAAYRMSMASPRDVEFLAATNDDDQRVDGILQGRKSISTPAELRGRETTGGRDRATPSPAPSEGSTSSRSIKTQLPPPPRRTTPASSLPSRGRSEDTLRRPASSTSPLINLGTKSGALAGVNRRLAQWTDESSSSSSSGGGLASKGAAHATNLLRSAPGTLGSAVSNGWNTWRGSKPPTSTSENQLSSTGTANGSTFPSFGRKPSFGTTASASHNDLSHGLGDGVRGNERDGPFLSSETIKRHAKVGTRGAVFGVDPQSSAERWPAEQASTGSSRRRECLPAVALRCVDHLEHWAPKEEGIFRISGRSTHVALLRKQFDAGADLDLVSCDPGDIDPHAVASLYKAYLRELPVPILTSRLSPSFDALLQRHCGVRATEHDFGAGGAMASLHVTDSNAKDLPETRRSEVQMQKALRELLDQLTDAHWYLLSDLARLLGSTAKHSSENKMGTQNLLILFCPTLSLTPPFLRQLIDHHSTLFVDTRQSAVAAPKLPARPISTVEEMLAPTVLTEDQPALTLLTTAHTATNPSPRVSPRFSTPIADLFARTEPITLMLREKPPT